MLNVESPKDSSSESIDEQVFGECTSLTNLSVDPNDTKLFFGQSTLMNRDKTNIMLFLQTSRNNVYIVPESVEKISAFAFSNCRNLKYVVIPEGKMTYIGINAFKGCKKLSFLNLPSCISVISNQIRTSQ